MTIRTNFLDSGIMVFSGAPEFSGRSRGVKKFARSAIFFEIGGKLGKAAAIGLNRLLFSLHPEGVFFEKSLGLTQVFGGVAAHHQIKIILVAGHAFQAKRHVDHVPDHGIVALPVLGKVAQHGLAGVECRPDLQRPGKIRDFLVEIAGESVDGNGCFQRLQDVVPEIWPCPQGHDRVPDEFIDDPVMFVYQLADPSGPVLEKLGNPLVPHVFGQPGEIVDIADQDGDDLFLDKCHCHFIEVRAGWWCRPGWGRFLVEQEAGAADADAVSVLQGDGGMDFSIVFKLGE